MKNYQKKLAAVLSGMMLLAGTVSLLPENRAFPSVSMTVSAAEEDLPWATYLKNSADWFGTSEATKVADQCIQYQVANEGGWQKGMLTSHTGDWAHSTIDNDATTSQIRFLMRTYNATKQQKYLDCAMRGVDCLFKMQYSNGGWMQCLNTPGTYHAHITLNDAAYIHVLEIMNEMSKKSGDFTAVSDAYAQKAAASLEKGIQCLLDMQISVGGRKTAWCQQHDENTLAPASARAYELPSICTSESAGVITFLYNYAKANPDRKDIVRSVNAAIEWFKKVTLYGIKFVKQGDDKVVVQDANADPLWARFYTLDTEVPMFSDRDSKVYYDVAQISQERRTGYAWYGNWGKNIIKLALLPDDGSPVQPEQPEQPVQKPEYSGTLISKLVVNDTDNGGSWSIAPDFGTGSKIYGDRDYTVTAEGNGVGTGGEQIRTACDSKKYSGDLAALTAAEDLKLNIYLDQRVLQSLTQEQLSTSWLKDYVHMRTQVFSSNGEEFTVFTRDVKKGETVTLGSNFTSQNCVNYFAAVYPVIAETTTTTAEATTTTVTTATTTVTTTGTVSETTATTTAAAVKRTMPGDADCSGDVDVSDAVLLARYLGEDDTAVITAVGKLNADCDGVIGLTNDDGTMILQYVAKLIREFPDFVQIVEIH